MASQKLFLWAHLEWNRQGDSFELVGWGGSEAGRGKSLASGHQSHCGNICISWPWSISVGESNSFFCKVSKPLPSISTAKMNAHGFTTRVHVTAFSYCLPELDSYKWLPGKKCYIFLSYSSQLNQVFNEELAPGNSWLRTEVIKALLKWELTWQIAWQNYTIFKNCLGVSVAAFIYIKRHGCILKYQKQTLYLMIISKFLPFSKDIPSLHGFDDCTDFASKHRRGT